MTRRRFTVVLLLVCFSLLATPALGQAATDVPGEWRTLGPATEEIDRSNQTRVATDLSAVLDRDADRLAIQHHGQTLAYTIDSSDDEFEKFDVMARDLDRIERRVRSLQERERRATARYSEGQLQGLAYLHLVAGVDQHSESLEDRLVALRRQGRSIESRAIVTRSNDLLVRVRSLQGTVRGHVSAVNRAQEEPVMVYAETANRSLVLASATGQDYVREVTVAPNRADTGTSIGLAGAVSLVGDSYPELFEARQGLEVGGSRSAGSYRVDIVGTGEFLTAYVDANSRRVFREDRRVSLARLSLVSGPDTTESGYRLSVDHTYRGGPMRVTVVGPDGEPAPGEIAVGGQAVGRTGTDGQRWTIAPTGETTVRATVDGTELSVPFSAPSPPPLNTTAAA